MNRRKKSIISKNIFFVCIACKKLINLTGLTISSNNELYINYNCPCSQNSKLLFTEYYEALQYINNIPKEKCATCSKLNIVNDAIGFCLDCQKSICKSHLSLHKLHIIFKKKIEDIPNKCIKHINKIAHFKCLECSDLLCRDCYNQHKEHKTINIQNYYKETKSLIDISLLDNEFFVAMLNQILAHKKREVQNGLSSN